MKLMCTRPPAALMVALGLGLAACSEDATQPREIGNQPELAAASTQAPLSFRQISSFSGHTCGVTTTDQAYCWGYNVQGQIGDGTEGGSKLRPVAVVGGHQFLRVIAGGSHTCGITTANQAYCWGENRFGQLGDGTTTKRSVPGPVAGGIAFSELVAGVNHTCGLGLNGVAYCWGGNSEGQLGDGTIGGARAVPARVAHEIRFHQLTAGAIHNCGLGKNLRILCWGSNRVGQLGGGTTIARRAQPARVAGNHLFTNVGGKWSHTCGITTERRTYCWGDNSYGALGHGTAGEVRYAPVIVVGDRKFYAVDGGMWHTCALGPTSKLRCWGGNEFGQLGNGTTQDRFTPGSAIQDLAFDQMAAGGVHTCGLTVFDGRAYCWGGNNNGELGDGTTTHRTRPTPVADPS